MDSIDLPSNSREKKVNAPAEAPRVAGKVVTGKVIQRKKPVGRRFLDTFVAGEAKGVGHYVIFEILIPAAKDVIADVVSQGVERLIFGEARSTSRRTGAKPGGIGHVNYSRFSSASPPWARDRSQERQSISQRARATHDFDEIVLATRQEANDVLEQMYAIISQYEEVTVGDMYDLVGLSGNFTDAKWGWTDLSGSNIVRVSNGYLLDLPRPQAMV